MDTDLPGHDVAVRGLRPAAVSMVLLLLAPLLLVLPQPTAADETAAQFKTAAQSDLDERLDDAGLVPMSAGGAHTCAIGADGNAYCWGAGSFGRLGDGISTMVATPTQVSADIVETFIQLTAASTHSCGLAPDGTAYCWGDNDNGQLGDGTSSNRSAPTQVTGTTVSFTQLTAGNAHTCGLATDGAAYCWGWNNKGRTGFGETTSSQTTPKEVSTGTVATFTQLTAGRDHTCGLDANGDAYCWGDNGSGRLGTGDTNDRSTPTQVTGTTATFTQLTAGREHTCGIDANGDAHCWGFNGQGRLGVGEVGGDRSTPTQVTGTTATFTQLTAGGNHTCGIDANGGAYCWGNNNNGQLGDDDRGDNTK